MADRYWVGGSGTWNNVSTTNWSTTSGGPTGASPPVAGDDVFFNSASNGTSYTVTMVASTTYAYRNITINGPLTGTVTFSSGSSATHNISGSVAVAASGVASLGSNLWSSVNLTATTSGQTISLNGNTFSTVTFNGVGGAWTITTNGGAASNTTLTAGTLNLDSVTWNAGNDFISSNSNVRALNLGSATINVGDDWTFTTTTNLTFSAGTSTINMTGTSTAAFGGGGLTYNTVNFAPSGTGVTQNISGENTFVNVSFLGPTGSSSYNSYQIANNQIITGTLTATGASAIRRIFLRSTTITTTITLTAAAVALAQVDFQSITVAGAAVPATGTGLGDCGGNSGITFPAAKTVYWNLSGTQNWSSTGWATAPSGSPAIENFPLAQDTAVFTDSGAAGTVSIQAFNIGAVDASGRTAAMTLNYGTVATFYGSHTWGSGLSITGSSTQTFSGRGTMTFTTAGKTTTFPIVVNCVTGTFQLGDALTSSNSITHTSGTFITNSNTITCTTFNSSNSNTRTLNLGTSTINLSSTGTVWTLATITGLSFTGGASTINLTNTTTTARTMIMGTGVSYGTINIGGATGTSTTTIDATTNNITTLSSTKTVAHTIRFTTSVTIANWTVTGTAGNVVTVNSNTVGTQTPITYSGSRIDLDYMSFTDVNFSYTLGAANPYLVYAGANSVNGGNNNGIAFLTSSQTAYRLTTGTTWTVPAGWNNSNNVIHMIGAGGGGATSAVSGNNRAAGGGGGGGGYTVVSNYTATPSSSVAYQIGTSSANANGGDTGFGQNAISFVGSTTLADTAASTTHVMDVPAGTADGDLMVLFICSSTSNVYTVPTGWTAALNSTGMMSCYRTASSEPASYTVTTSNSLACSGYIVTYTNAQFDTIGTQSAFTTPSVAPSINVAYDNSVVLDFPNARAGSITFTTPTGFSSIASESNATNPSSALFSRSFNAGATGTVSTTPSSSNAASILLAIKPTSFYIAGGGQRGDATTAPLSTGGAGGTGTFAGGTGGAGAFGTIASTGYGSGGGGGAGGPNGVGGNGGNGFASTTTANVAGGGGGGNGGGGNGTNASSAQGGNGGNNFAGTGSGAGSATTTGTVGTFGGGGGGGAGSSTGGSGGSGIDIANTIGGSGGRGGAGTTGTSAANTGLYGGGGGGGGVSTGGSLSNGNAGAPGVIFIVYGPGSDPIIMSGVTITGGVTFV